MAEKRRALGRGLGALIPTAPEPGRGEDAPARDHGTDVFFPPRRPTAVSRETSRGGDESSGAVSRETRRTREDALRDTLGTRPGQGSKRSSRSSTSPAAPLHAVADGEGTSLPDSSPSDGAELLPVDGARFAEILVDSIRPNPRQPRTVFDEEDMNELVHSISEIGVLQPVVVRPLGGDAYELVMGERRLRASKLAGLKAVPAIIRTTADNDMLRDALLENLHRSNLNPLEEAAAYQQMLDDFGVTQEVLASRIGRSRPQVSNTLRLLKLPPLVQRRVAAGVLSAGHARALLGLDDHAAMERLAQRIVAEGLSVRSVEELVTLGETGRETRQRSRRAAAPSAGLEDRATKLSDRLDTRVKIQMGKSRGRITVEFASVDDLDRILGTLGVD